MKFGKHFLLLALMILFSCSQKISKEDLVGHWYNTKLFGFEECILNSDGTGSAGNPTVTDLRDCSWEYRNDSLIISPNGNQTAYQVVKITEREGKKKTIIQLHLLYTYEYKKRDAHS